MVSDGFGTLHSGLLQRSRAKRPVDPTSGIERAQQQVAQGLVRSVSGDAQPAMATPPLRQPAGFGQQAPALDAVNAQALKAPTPEGEAESDATPGATAESVPAPKSLTDLVPKPEDIGGRAPSPLDQAPAPELRRPQWTEDDAPKAKSGEELKPLNDGLTRSQRARLYYGSKGNIAKQGTRGAKRKALTLRLDMDDYDRLTRAREEMGRTSQDILATSLSLYLNLMGVEEND